MYLVVVKMLEKGTGKESFRHLEVSPCEGPKDARKKALDEVRSENGATHEKFKITSCQKDR
jgi:hypothetical protein